MEKAMIVRIISSQYRLRLAGGRLEEAVVRGKLSRGQAPVVGDHVLADASGGRYAIEQILPRRNCLRRPSVANVDQAFIVMSVKEPDFSSVLVDRLIFLISYEGIEPVIVLTKTDLAGGEESGKIRAEYERAGYRVLSGRDSLERFTQQMQGRITVLCGQSGVGKSSILNRLEPSFCLRTQPISAALGRGKHTTRHTELYEVCGGMVADTPGFSSLDFSRIDSRRLACCVPDFRNAPACRFADCRHEKEPGCAVRDLVEKGRISSLRYEHYRQVLPECDQIKEWEER